MYDCRKKVPGYLFNQSRLILTQLKIFIIIYEECVEIFTKLSITSPLSPLIYHTFWYSNSPFIFKERKMKKKNK